MYNHREFIIFPITELSKVNFSQVMETSEKSLRLSVDGTKTFIKWNDVVPSFILSLNNTEGPYIYEEMLTILSTSEWDYVLEIREIIEIIEI